MRHEGKYLLQIASPNLPSRVRWAIAVLATLTRSQKPASASLWLLPPCASLWCLMIQIPSASQQSRCESSQADTLLFSRPFVKTHREKGNIPGEERVKNHLLDSIVQPKILLWISFNLLSDNCDLTHFEDWRVSNPFTLIKVYQKLGSIWKPYVSFVSRVICKLKVFADTPCNDSSLPGW